MKNDTYYKAINMATGEVIADKVKIARDFRSRSVGLLNRISLGQEEALVIKPCNSIHTFFMKFPIDVAFLDKRGAVVKLVKSLKPWRLSACIPMGFMVLELSEGKLEEINIKQGDLIKITK